MVDFLLGDTPEPHQILKILWAENYGGPRQSHLLWSALREWTAAFPIFSFLIPGIQSFPHIRGDAGRKHIGDSNGMNCFMKKGFKSWTHGRSPRSWIFSPYFNHPPRTLFCFSWNALETSRRISHRERCRQDGGLGAGREVNLGNSIMCSVGEEAGELRGLFSP